MWGKHRRSSAAALLPAVGVLASDKVQGAHWPLNRVDTLGVSLSGAAAVPASRYNDKKGPKKIQTVGPVSCFHSFSGFIRWSEVFELS